MIVPEKITFDAQNLIRIELTFFVAEQLRFDIGPPFLHAFSLTFVERDGAFLKPFSTQNRAISREKLIFPNRFCNDEIIIEIDVAIRESGDPV